MTTPAFLAAILGLLLSPGPSNTLMALAGAAGGGGRVLRLIPAEILGYLTTILPLAALGAALLQAHPGLATGLKLVAAGWVLFLAARLWARGGADAAAGVTFGRLYLTTVLNPKALIFGLVLLPTLHDPAFAARLGLFLATLTGVALVWGLGGALVRRGAAGGRRMLILRRLAASWLTVVALSLIGGVVSA